MLTDKFINISKTLNIDNVGVGIMVQINKAKLL